MSHRIFIVEDDPIIAMDIKDIVEEAGFQCLGIAFSALEAKEKIEQIENLDLILCDISIEGSQSGVELIADLKRTKDFAVIYVSSHSDAHTMKLVKETAPVGYLVKPIQPKTLISSIEIGMLNADNKPSNDSTFNTDYLFIKDKGTYLKVEYKNIYYAEAFDNYTYVFTESAKFLVPITLKEVEKRLQAHKFLRIHRSYLVSPRHIQSIEGSFLSVGKATIPIGKKYKSELLKKFNLM